MIHLTLQSLAVLLFIMLGLHARRAGWPLAKWWSFVLALVVLIMAIEGMSQ